MNRKIELVTSDSGGFWWVVLVAVLLFSETIFSQSPTNLY